MPWPSTFLPNQYWPSQMATEIDVLYSDFTRSGRVPLFIGGAFTAEAHALRTDGVLCISISIGWGDRANLVSRLWSREHGHIGQEWYGNDHYTIGIIGSQFFAEQYDDDDAFFLVRDIVNPGGGTTNSNRPARYPAGADLLEFTGEWVNPTDWQNALTIFDTEMF